MTIALDTPVLTPTTARSSARTALTAPAALNPQRSDTSRGIRSEPVAALATLPGAYREAAPTAVPTTPSNAATLSGETGNPAAPTTPGTRLPQGTEARGFALYVGLDEVAALAAGVDLGTIVQALKRTLSELAPTAESYASIALAPAQVGGRDLDVVRLALRDPAAIAKRHGTEEQQPSPERKGVVVDISRKRVQLDGQTATLTYKEFELLQFLVLREGRTIDRNEIISSLWGDAEGEDIPSERTIDVHVRRLRSKLGRYEDIVRTVRGVGYRFDRHADVTIRHPHAPSPDLI